MILSSLSVIFVIFIVVVVARIFFIMIAVERLFLVNTQKMAHKFSSNRASYSGVIVLFHFHSFTFKFMSNRVIVVSFKFFFSLVVLVQFTKADIVLLLMVFVFKCI